jgi:hypothetical protein
LQAVDEAGSVDALLFDMGVIDNAVEGAEQEDGDKTRVFDRPSVGTRASLKQIAKKIDGDVVDEPLSRGRARSVKKNVMQANGIEISGDGGHGPCRELPLPIVRRL